MKKFLFCSIVIALISGNSYSQEFERRIFNYNELDKENPVFCNEQTMLRLQDVIVQLEKFNSKEALKISEQVFASGDVCPDVFETHAWTMFRSGKWLESIIIIDSAILRYGAHPGLILRRAFMNLEMAELGVDKRDIDGSNVFLPAEEKLPYKVSTFKKQNYRAALNDFKYLADNYNDRENEIYLSAYILQKLGEFEASGILLEKLLGHDAYSKKASELMIDNLLIQGRLEEAETALLEMEKINPRETQIQKRFYQLYKISGDTIKQQKTQKKYEFYHWAPEYTNLEFSEENYNIIRYFIEDHPVSEKLKSIKKVARKKDENAIDFLVSVLYAHENHDNGLEEEIEKLLISIGKPAVPKVIFLMQQARSTCTVSKAASILAEIRDERAWQAMVDNLYTLDKLPATTMPPNISEQLIKFNRERALLTILEWLKPNISSEKAIAGKYNNDWSLILNSSVKYAPLAIYKKSEIVNAATTTGYNQMELESLLKLIGTLED